MARFTEEELREAIAASRSWAEATRRLGYYARGGNPATVQRHAIAAGVSIDHFDPRAQRRSGGAVTTATPLARILVERSTYNRAHLKTRLLAEGLKQPVCEECGQPDIWRGQPMAMVLDHINGVPDDNRLENLRILCPNCSATLDTHCGRKNMRRRAAVPCAVCGEDFFPKSARQRHCSRACGWRSPRPRRPGRRKVARPPVEQLRAEVEQLGWRGTGRRYGVSDNAVRNWLRADPDAQASPDTP